MYNNKDDKIWRVYEIVDIETGEILDPKNYDKKNYLTINTEKNEYKERGYRVEQTIRKVKHNGQTKLFN